MAPHILVLGGTTGATQLCQALAEAGLRGICSLAGRVERPRRQPLPLRVGGFGGVDGLVAYMRDERITHLVDATHPFAAQMSGNAVEAAAKAGVPLIALTRPPWTPEPGDQWIQVANIEAAVDALDRPATRVLLTVGRLQLSAFSAHLQHFYLLRLVDPPRAPLAFPDHQVILDRGPFEVESDLDLLRTHRIDLVVSKNSGGEAAQAKIIAARRLELPVIMIDRPVLPPRLEAHRVDEVLDWLAHTGNDLGV